MEKRIERAVLECKLDTAYEKVIIGFSGGADSSALLHYFAKRAKRVACVHINHMIRGAEADRDEAFCRATCEKYGIEFICHRIDIPKIATERGQGIEETARQERYRVFYSELERLGFDAILTAHNANDNAESVIFNLVRGSGANGISGIKPINGRVLRPLLYATREQIIEYCSRNGIEYVTDSTNADTDYTRNYIRHKVIPSLSELNPSLLDAILRLSTALRSDEELISSLAQDFVAEKCKDGKIPPEAIQELHESVRVRALKMLAGENLDSKAIYACLDFIPRSHSGSVINLCNGISLKRESEYLMFIKTSELGELEFNIPLKKGLNDLSPLDLVLALDTDEVPDGYECVLEISLNAKSISGPLYARSRAEGDTICHGKLTKKLKKLFCEKKIPSHKRDKTPIICDDNGIVAVAKVAIRDGAKGKDIKIKLYERGTRKC